MQWNECYICSFSIVSASSHEQKILSNEKLFHSVLHFYPCDPHPPIPNSLTAVTLFINRIQNWPVIKAWSQTSLLMNMDISPSISNHHHSNILQDRLRSIPKIPHARPKDINANFAL